MSANGTAAAAPPHSLLNSGAAPLAGRYQLRERLGRGSAAEVFRAVDLEGGPDVAVKIATAGSLVAVLMAGAA